MLNFNKIILILIYIFINVNGMSIKHKNELKEKTKEMIYHAFNGYMNYGFPSDELYPITCKGRDRDNENNYNFGVNDILGNFTLTLIDSLDTLAIIGDKKLFQKAVQNVIDKVDFNKDNIVNLFEVNIRILGGLLSAHLFAINEQYGVKLDNYNNELLDLAYDLGKRLLPAFEKSKTQIPYTRVNLKKGVISIFASTSSCAADAGTFILEFGTLSRLTGDSRFEEYARDALFKMWDEKSSLNLLGTAINSLTSRWSNRISGIGASSDS
jgi:hypothetical protein